MDSRQRKASCIFGTETRLFLDLRSSLPLHPTP